MREKEIVWGIWDIKKKDWHLYNFDFKKKTTMGRLDFLKSIENGAAGRYEIRSCYLPRPLPKKRKG